jgi:hypothetical protein
VSEAAIKFHLANLYDKFDVSGKRTIPTHPIGERGRPTRCCEPCRRRDAGPSRVTPASQQTGSALSDFGMALPACLHGQGAEKA